MTRVNEMFINVNVNQSSTDAYVGDMSLHFLQNPKKIQLSLCGKSSIEDNLLILRFFVLCEQHCLTS